MNDNHILVIIFVKAHKAPMSPEPTNMVATTQAKIKPVSEKKFPEILKRIINLSCTGGLILNLVNCLCDVLHLFCLCLCGQLCSPIFCMKKYQ